MKDLELLCNLTDFCLTVNYCVVVLIIMQTLMMIKKIQQVHIKLTCHYTSISSVNPLRMKSQSKLYNIIFVNNLPPHLKNSDSTTA